MRLRPYIADMPIRTAFVVLTFLLSAAPSYAWEASSGDVCEVAHEEESASVLLTYDLERLDYTISFSLSEPWAGGSVFALQFNGPFGNTITTDRQVMSGEGKTLTVTDSGFGNVLNGLEFNDSATAILGDQAVTVSLEGAAPAVQAFRACTMSLRV